MRPDSVSPATTSSPLRLLLAAYDQAISACRARNASRAYRSIAILQAAHPCDSPSAGGILGLYDWCERAVLSGDFIGAARTLEQLRSAWETADRITNVPSMTVSSRASVVLPDAPMATRARLD